MTNRADALGSAFAGAGNTRTDALKNITLPARVSPASTPMEMPAAAETGGTSVDRPVEPGEAVRATPTRSRVSAPSRPASIPESDPGSARSTIVYVTPPMREELRQQTAREPHVTFTDLVLDALETHEPDLRAAWAQTRPRGGRFTRTSTSRRGRRDEPGVQLALRLTKSNVAALDSMVAELGAPSRTALVEEALRLYYDRSR